MIRRARRGVVLAVALALEFMLCGCASTSTPSRFHTLVPPIGPAAAASTRAAPAVRVEVLPVTLPVQVDVAQIVVRLPDDSMRALEHERWIAPLADEIRTALLLRIDAALAAAPTPAAGPPWRVALEVQRFDSTLGDAAALQAVWALQQPGGNAMLRCQVNDRESVASGPVALVTGHRVMLERLGDAIGRAIRAAAGGAVPACA